MSVAIDTLRAQGGELENADNGKVDSREDNTTYDLKRGGDDINPDYIHDLGDGYVLLVEAEDDAGNGRAVVMDADGNVWEIWGDPHVTWHNGDEHKGGFDFINNMTLELANGKRITLGTTTNTQNGMTFLDEIMVYDPNTQEAVVYDVGDEPSKEVYHGQNARDMENAMNDGAEIIIGENLSKVQFINENGTWVDQGDVWQDKNDTTAEFAKVKGERNETIELLLDEAFFEEMDIDLTDSEDRDALSLGLLLLIVFQERQDGIQDFLRVRLDELDGNNAEINKINALLDSVVAGIEGDGEDPVEIPKSAYDFIVSSGVLDPNDPNIAEHIEDNGDGTYSITGSVLKQALTSKAEELQNMSQQLQQQIQFSFSNLTNSSETLTSSLKGFYDMIKSIARNAGG